MNKRHFEIALFEIFQMILVDKEVLDKNGYPPRKLTKLTLEEQEAVKIYTWLGERIKGSSQALFDASKEEFNKYAKGLTDSVYLNMFLMALFMLDRYMIDEPINIQIVIGNKVERLIKYLKAKITEVDERHEEVIYDSSMTAANIYRKYNNQAELSREIRKKRVQMWKNRNINRKKIKEE